MSNVQASPTHGFLVVNASGDRIAAAEHIEDSLQLVRALPDAVGVVRASDGERLAFRPAQKSVS